MVGEYAKSVPDHLETREGAAWDIGYYLQQTGATLSRHGVGREGEDEESGERCQMLAKAWR